MYPFNGQIWPKELQSERNKEQKAIIKYFLVAINFTYYIIVENDS